MTKCTRCKCILQPYYRYCISCGKKQNIVEPMEPGSPILVRIQMPSNFVSLKGPFKEFMVVLDNEWYKGKAAGEIVEINTSEGFHRLWIYQANTRERFHCDREVYLADGYDIRVMVRNYRERSNSILKSNKEIVKESFDFILENQ